MATAARVDEHMIMQRREEARRLKESALLRRAVPVSNSTAPGTAATTGRSAAAAVPQPPPQPQGGASGCRGHPSASAATTVVDPKQLRRVMSGKSTDQRGVGTGACGGSTRSDTLTNPTSGASVAASPSRVASGAIDGTSSRPVVRGSALHASGSRTFSGSELGSAVDQAVAAAAEEQHKLRLSARQLRGVGLTSSNPASPSTRRATSSPDRKVRFGKPQYGPPLVLLFPVHLNRHGRPFAVQPWFHVALELELCFCCPLDFSSHNRALTSNLNGTFSPQTENEREATNHNDFTNRMFLRAQLRGTASLSNSAGAQPAVPPNPSPAAAPPQAVSGSQQPRAGSSSFKSLRASTGRVPSPVINNAPIRNSRMGNGVVHPGASVAPSRQTSRPGTPDMYIPPRPASACSYTSSSSFASQVVSPTATQKPKVAAVSRPATSSVSQVLAPKPSGPVKPTSVKAYSPWEAGDAVHTLRAARKKLGKEAFIEYVYTNHPPKDPSKKLNPKLDVKKQMQKALSHYHPDKQNMQEHGPEWCLICEEVCKEITRMYKKRASPQ